MNIMRLKTASKLPKIFDSIEGSTGRILSRNIDTKNKAKLKSISQFVLLLLKMLDQSFILFNFRKGKRLGRICKG